MDIWSGKVSEIASLAVETGSWLGRQLVGTSVKVKVDMLETLWVELMDETLVASEVLLEKGKESQLA